MVGNPKKRYKTVEKHLVRISVFTYAAISLVQIWAPLSGIAQETDHLIHAQDLIYEGAFAFPEGDAWAYSGQALTYFPRGDPSGDGDGYPGSLYAAGSMTNETGDRVGEMSIPTPVAARNFDALPQAMSIQPLTDITGGWKDNCTYNDDCLYRDIDGLAYLPQVNKIAWNLNDWYNAAGYDQDSLGWSELDMSGARGVWHIGPRNNDTFHNAKACNYLFIAPQDFADTYLGGKSLIAGNTREAGANGGSQGPTLYATAPWKEGVPPAAGQAVDALALLYYRERIPCVWDPWPDINETPGPGVCDFPDYRASDHWNGGAWIGATGKSAILIVGRKGLGANCYGNVECGDTCDASQGYHAYPYDPQMLFYDPVELIEVTQGLREPWTVLPKEIYSISEVVLKPSCAELGAAAYDRERHILYVTEQQAGPNGETVVHVWKVNSGPLYVDSNGCKGGIAPCYRSIQEAIDAAADGNHIAIAQGTYSESLALDTSKSLTIEGGWNRSFTSQTPDTTFMKAPHVLQGSLTIRMVIVKP